MKKNAFTLAEVLIVIAIIGVVATVTLPNLSNNTSDIENVAKVKKTVATLQTAVDMAREKYGEDMSTWIVDDTTAAAQATRFGTRISQYLSISKSCGSNTNQGCFSSSQVTAITGNRKMSAIDASEIYKFVLNDGTSVAVRNLNGGPAFYFDVDGPNKGYNTFGRDVFYLPFTSDGDTNIGVPVTYSGPAMVNWCRSAVILQGCTGWVMNFDNMDYVKCADLTSSKTTCN